MNFLKIKITKPVVFLLALAGISLFLNAQGFADAERLFSLLEAYPILSPLIFILIYILFTVLLLPTLPLNLGAGVIWGTWLGGTYVLLGFASGALLSFVISRYFLSDFIRKKISIGVWGRILKTVEGSGWRTVAFTRINPIFPSGPLNYLFGLAKLGALPYITATASFSTPLVFAFSHVGETFGTFLITGDIREFITKVFLISGLILIISSIGFFFKKLFIREEH